MKKITFVYAYYDNPLMLAEQLRLWASYPDELRRRVSVVLVDDASPRAPAAQVERPPSLPPLQIYRVAVDLPWHQDGARNLGAHVAEEGWMFLSDMDHAMPAGSLRRLLGTVERDDGERRFFTFPRLEAPRMTPVRKGPGANIFAVTRRTYWKRMLGYDEDMCGQYGSDGEPRRRLMQAANRTVLHGCPVVRYERSVIPDASTTAWERHGPEQDARRRGALARKAALGRAGKITHLDFAWSRVL